MSVGARDRGATSLLAECAVPLLQRYSKGGSKRWRFIVFPFPPMPTSQRGLPVVTGTWVELTGQELDANDGAVRVHDAATWQQRRRQLEALGGAPAR